MGLLHDKDTGTLVPLPARTLFGRAATATVRLEDRRVSGEHATLLWTNGGWVLRDLGSRNGTFVDGARLASGGSMPLKHGATLGFGSPEARFLLSEASPPGPVARDLDAGELRALRDGLLLLPDDDHPEVVLFDDGRGHWALEIGDERRDTANRDVVRAGGRSWQLLLPEDAEGTATVDMGPTLSAIELRFRVSPDEEHVEAWYVHQGTVVALERREHLYLLLVLARQRVAERSLPLSEQGWVERDQLARWLKVEPSRINVAIHRARGQLARSGVLGSPEVVEVRRGQRRIGIEPDRLDVSWSGS